MEVAGAGLGCSKGNDADSSYPVLSAEGRSLSYALMAAIETGHAAQESVRYARQKDFDLSENTVDEASRVPLVGDRP